MSANTGTSKTRNSNALDYLQRCRYLSHTDTCTDLDLGYYAVMWVGISEFTLQYLLLIVLLLNTQHIITVAVMAVCVPPGLRTVGWE